MSNFQQPHLDREPHRGHVALTAPHDRNGRKTTKVVTPAPAEPHEHPMSTRTFSDVTQMKLTQIVVTPMRTVDLLEHDDGHFSLRETSYSGRGAGVEQIHFYPHELEKLEHIIQKVRMQNEAKL